MPVVGKVAAQPPAAELQAATRSLALGNPIAFAALALLGVVLYLVAILFSQGGTVFAVSELYLGRATSIGQSLSRAKSELGTLFGVLFLNGLVMIIGLLLLIIPGIYMMFRLCVAVPAALLENLGPRDSLERSFALTKDNAGRAFLNLSPLLCYPLCRSDSIRHPVWRWCRGFPKTIPSCCARGRRCPKLARSLPRS